MLEGYSPVTQALLGTLFTWALTAAGAALVFVFSSRQKRILDGSLGFAAGVMLAASYWSLLAPAIDMAEQSGKYGSFAFMPVAVGFALGAAFVYFADLAMPLLGVGADPHTALALSPDSKLAKEKAEQPSFQLPDSDELTVRIGRAGPLSDKMENGDVHQRRRGQHPGSSDGPEGGSKQQDGAGKSGNSWRRVVLLILAITIHNIPASPVGMGAVTLPLSVRRSFPLNNANRVATPAVHQRGSRRTATLRRQSGATRWVTVRQTVQEIDGRPFLTSIWADPC
ncbi:Zinc transporter SLC39A11 isoform 2 [Scophthalmus maximus]|uniref:Zinc transporter ZIP11 n=1 Tax=Scophthalmus maximus TaxID=52904 RepID=A0A2U9CN85_SCOMX|nr:zinc transporter ZIP11 isoform X4 [Scophthalmus maximus]AWP17299.1 Zinc transporter SLC39A11 isoform 2 [Scophthalmus maximus]